MGHSLLLVAYWSIFLTSCGGVVLIVLSAIIFVLGVVLGCITSSGQAMMGASIVFHLTLEPYIMLGPARAGLMMLGISGLIWAIAVVGPQIVERWRMLRRPDPDL